MSHFRWAVTVGLIFLSLTSTSRAGSAPGFKQLQVEYCALVKAETCLPTLAKITLSFPQGSGLPDGTEATLYAMVGADPDQFEGACTEDSLICVRSLGTDERGRMICLEITIDAQSLPQCILGRFLVIQVDLQPANPDQKKCSFPGPSVVLIDTSCIDGAKPGQVFRGHLGGLFRVIQLFPPDCGPPIATQSHTWGALKAMYR